MTGNRHDYAEDTHRPLIAIIIAVIITIAAFVMFASAGHAQTCDDPRMNWPIIQQQGIAAGWVEQEIKGAEAAQLVAAVNAIEPVTNHKPDRVMIWRHPTHTNLMLTMTSGQCLLLGLMIRNQTELDRLMKRSGA